MLEDLTAQEWLEWLAYAEAEPFGEERADLRMAILAAVEANVHRSRRGQKTYKPQDFMPKFEGKKDPKDKAVQTLNTMKFIAAAFNAKAKGKA